MGSNVVILSFFVLVTTLGQGFASSLPIEDRIYRGTQAFKGQFPYQVYVKVNRGVNATFRECSGAILSQQWIITSASCIAEAQSAIIQAGSNMINLTDSNRATKTASRFYHYEGFDGSRETLLLNNIGLIGLNQSLVFNDFIRPIPLATADTPDGTLLTASGWGAISQVPNAGSVNYLQYIALKSIATANCSDFPLYKNDLQLNNNTICAVSTTSLNKTICEGDAGAPLVQNAGVKPVLVGVGASYAFRGATCTNTESPSAFTKVFKYLEWITRITGIPE